MRFELFIAHRHLTRRRKTGFISLISLISVGGVALGVMALIVVLSVMTGFDNELQRKIVSVQPHLRIEKTVVWTNGDSDLQKVRDLKIPTLKSLSRFIEKQAILRTDHAAQGVVVMGVDTENEDFSFYQKSLVSGTLGFQDSMYTETKRTWWFKKKTEESQVPSLIIGDILASRLKVQVGDVINLITPESEEKKNPFLPLPMHVKTWPVLVRGIFHVGMNDADSTLALISLKTAQKFYFMDGKISGLSLRFDKLDDAEKWKWILAGEFSSEYYLASWYDMNQNFFQALKVEKAMVGILLSLIIVVAAFNIISTLIMVAMEKTKDIGILRALGATKGAVRKIFLIEGMSYGFWGMVLGVTSGVLISLKINAIADFLKVTFGIEVFPRDIYIFDRIPAEVQPHDVVVIASFAFIIAVLAALYPAHRAASLKPVEALRYE
ncbi:MAG: lipoprotein-releasing ABC transporter permease subunit [Candidatus Omnitrophica bacterium]|nr:lipoprotein-releasing ABC transporter permease subunit [Candidatus Omnitrophota bacterium]